MQIVDNHPNFTQLQFCIEMVKMLIGDFSSWQHAVQEGTVQTGHWPVKMSKGRCKRCLKRKKTTFCGMGCDSCGERFCLDCFKNHSTEAWHGTKFKCLEQWTLFCLGYKNTLEDIPVILFVFFSNWSFLL